ncbi:ABC transporter ATP-binding protein [Nocardioides mangrovi]|uniref:ABC transporter ATP-binding protein n=1 Tax=Nocardioides mangrovi TaxID=2874580 RepID=A0ABS7U8A9_9ACTN|nr:ABC transporter ATP-binding protein [Nocardioides mangrovi]MBZ5737092.1 ABC transporter ATP-binding protein [Nocardioides mangrovi]
MTALLQVDDLTLDLGDTPILRGVSLAVRPGEALGIVGESGSGKSMTLRTVARLLPDSARTGGAVRVGDRDVLGLRGRELREHRRGLGMVFQDPRSAINPVHTVGAFLVERARDAGQDTAAAREQALTVLRRMGMTDPERRMRQHPFELSGGLLQRVMIASVLMERPRLLLADEPTTALDVTTQADVLALTDELRREMGAALVLVTHDLDLASAVCDRIAVMYGGRVLETAPAATLRDDAVHPYTRALLASRPPLDQRLTEIPVAPGSPVPAAQTGPGCPFVDRCPVALPICGSALPEERLVGASRVRCHRVEEVA